MSEPQDRDTAATTASRPYVLTRCETSTGKFYMRRQPWIDMSDFGWGWRIDGSGGQRVSPYFEKDAMDELRRWCQHYTDTHPGNTLDAKEASDRSL